MSVDADAIREHVETDLSTTAINRLLAADLEAINNHAGDPSAEIENLRCLGARSIFLRCDVSEITSVTTRAHEDDGALTLAADDYRLDVPRELVRLGDGTNGQSGWYGKVTVTYVPIVDEDLRDRVLIDLVKLAIEHRALKSEGDGEYKATFAEYEEARRGVLSQLRGRKRVLA